jgi:hypothetical protein
MEVLSYDFSKMDIRVDLMNDSEDPLIKFDIFSKYQEFHEATPISKKRVLKYIVYVYHKNSPIRGADILKTKITAAALAGFKRKANNSFENMVEEMMLCNIEVINKMIVRFIVAQKDITFQKYCILQEAYARESKEVLEGTAANIKSFTDIERELNETQDKLLNDDSVDLKKQLYKYYLEDKVELSPEDIAEKLKQNPNELPC